MEKIRSLRNKLLGLSALAMASLACAEGEAIGDPMTTLTTLSTKLESVSSQVNSLYVVLGGIALAITVGVIAVKLTKKGRSVG